MLPVSAVFIIFIILLVMLIDQKQSNNALMLEYKASRLIDLLLDLQVNDQLNDPSQIDENITGFGIYGADNNSLKRYGSAPLRLPDAAGRNNEVIMAGRRSIVVIRTLPDDAAVLRGAESMMQRMPPNMQRRLQELRDDRDQRQPLAPMLRKYQVGIYIEYLNSGYISERRLIILLIILFITLFSVAAFFLFRLYRSNRRLIEKTEHDRQLIQLGEAARTLAHEIRNPLGALKIQRDLLVKKLPPGYETNLDIIDRELKRLNLLVDRVGEFLRNPVGKPEKIDLGRFVTELYGSRNEIVFSIPDSAACIYFDRERLRTVLDNIVNNAVESAGAAGIAVTEVSRGILLSVTDNGAGFTEEALRRMFDPFFTTKNSGTGLGLSVVKRLTEAAGGSVKINNRKEGGAEAELFFRRET